MIEPRALQGRFVRLEPYAPTLKDELRAALDCDGEAWSLLANSGQGEQFERWWSLHTGAMDRGVEVAYAVRRLADGRVVGTTSLMAMRPDHRGLEIGGTFIQPDARSGPINPDMKRLMLAEAFAADVVRVEILTDSRNARSQAAIAKLGATYEGVLRRHKITWTGYIRDTVIFAVTDLDWPAVQAGLDARLAGFAPAAP